MYLPTLDLISKSERHSTRVPSHRREPTPHQRKAGQGKKTIDKIQKKAHETSA
jgi:hypothetical protein